VSALDRLDRLAAGLARLGRGLAALSCLAAFAVVVAAVAMRYLFGRPLVWADEVSGWLVVSTAMLALAEAQYRGENVAVDLWLERARGRTLTALRLGGAAGVAVCGGVLLHQGWQMVAFSRMVGIKSNTLATVDVWTIQALVPIGGALLLAIALVQSARIVAGRPISADEGVKAARSIE